ncbi:hypothetical protein CesoFtcFv8_006696 [Champsocephalus esox]|uniref:Uncharacterized protein n=1 Tax=Champsocephalus esox TaxID=159716 RepID=A0AAN8CKE0_9TELE|nr:hypothetical protein CesoFtcFv8_006696 [Champsocephalus esox]
MTTGEEQMSRCAPDDWQASVPSPDNHSQSWQIAHYADAPVTAVHREGGHRQRSQDPQRYALTDVLLIQV